MKKKAKIFVGNLSWKTTEDQLKAHFETYGSVSNANIVTDPLTSKSRGFGFVEMEDEDAANTAIRELHDKPLLNRNLRVSRAQERTDQPRREHRGPRQEGAGHRSDYNR